MMPKKTWDEKFKEWRKRNAFKNNSGLQRAYSAGRRHQRKVCNENATKLKALLRETLESSDALTVNSNRLEAENKALKMAKNSLSIEYHTVVNSRYQLIDDIWELEAKLAKKWWQFWRKA